MKERAPNEPDEIAEALRRIWYALQWIGLMLSFIAISICLHKVSVK